LFNGYEYDIEQLRHALIQEKRKDKLTKMNKQKSISLAKGELPTAENSTANLPEMQPQRSNQID
jgi:hypothetical protein